MTKSKFYNELDIPSKSVMIIHTLMSDTRLGKTGKSRLTVAYVYGLLRRTCNLSLNNIKYHYSKKFNIIYEINRISTLVKRSELSPKTVRNALNILEKYGYIKRYTNRIKHLTLITMPLVLKYHIKSKVTAQVVDKFLAPTKNAGSTGKNYHSHRQKLSEAPAKNNSRCNGSYPNDSNHNDSCCNVDGKNDDKQQTTNNKTKVNISKIEHSLNKWFKETIHNNLGFPKSVLEIIRDNAKDSKQATNTTDLITRTKGKINMRYKGVYYTDYWRNENNPYIQNQLPKDLKNIYKYHLNLKKTIATKYDDYIDDNTDLQLRDDKANKQRKEDQRIYSGFNKTTYLDDLDDIRKDIAKDKKNNDSKKLAKDQKEFSKYVHLACKYTDLTPMYIKGTEEYKESTTFHRTNPMTVVKINKQLGKPKYADLSKKEIEYVKENAQEDDETDVQGKNEPNTVTFDPEAEEQETVPSKHYYDISNY